MTPDDLTRLLTLDDAWKTEVRAQWLRLLDLAVWGDLKGANLGAVSRVRKRVLELGEKWRSVFNRRDWIPQPREQIKSALASAASLRDSLLLLERASKEIDEGGSDFPEFERLLIALHKAVTGPLRERENDWANAMDRVNQEQLLDDEPND
ncbi:MAG: hypothetical protein ACYDDA_04845 [Acidiferrobacteraceae bacterium]